MAKSPRTSDAIQSNAAAAPKPNSELADRIINIVKEHGTSSEKVCAILLAIRELCPEHRQLSLTVLGLHPRQLRRVFGKVRIRRCSLPSADPNLSVESIEQRMAELFKQLKKAGIPNPTELLADVRRNQCTFEEVEQAIAYGFARRESWRNFSTSLFSKLSLMRVGDRPDQGWLPTDAQYAAELSELKRLTRRAKR